MDNDHYKPLIDAYKKNLRPNFRHGRGNDSYIDFRDEQQFLSLLLAESYRGLAKKLGIEEARDMYKLFLAYATEAIERKLGESVREVS